MPLQSKPEVNTKHHVLNDILREHIIASTMVNPSTWVLTRDQKHQLKKQKIYMQGCLPYSVHFL